ncbi:MAG: imelysin family protein [Vicingus serpentipes]|nr:imelysin family protein [Vicingus serpentipes]
MKKDQILFKLLFVFSLLILIGCSKDKDPVIPEDKDPEEYDRTALLNNYTHQYIQPAYAAYYNQVKILNNEVDSFIASPTILSLQNLRTEWEISLLIWQDVAFLEFGPAANISLRAQTNIYPVDTALIKSNISSGVYNLQAASNFDAKGFQALDFLLNGIAAVDADIVNYYTNTVNAKTYLQDVASEIETNASTVYNDWNSSYGTAFINNSASNAQGSSISDVVNAISQHYEGYIRKGKVGLPAGVFNGFSQLPMPEHVEAYYSNQSLPYVYRSLTSIQNFIQGKGYISTVNGEGLDDYMNFVNAQNNGQPLSTVINNQFSAIQVELGNINDPLSNEVVNNQSGVEAVYQKMQMLVPYIKIEMTNALEVLITYQDTDGD